MIARCYKFLRLYLNAWTAAYLTIVAVFSLVSVVIGLVVQIDIFLYHRFGDNVVTIAVIFQCIVVISAIVTVIVEGDLGIL